VQFKNSTTHSKSTQLLPILASTTAVYLSGHTLPNSCGRLGERSSFNCNALQTLTSNIGKGFWADEPLFEQSLCLSEFQVGLVTASHKRRFIETKY